MIEIHTLGPAGTNCERAAKAYLAKNKQQGTIHLHDTLELATSRCLSAPPDALLLGCIVYPKLHEIVFENLDTMKIVDCFVMDTYDMVFAAYDKNLDEIGTVCSHPAPQQLVSSVPGLPTVELTLVNSNSTAARRCREGEFDACISTRESTDANGLTVLKNFGPVPMGFSLHGKKVTAQ